MAKPRTLSKAIEEGYVVYSIYGKFNKRIRVDLRERFHKANRDMFLSFWIDRNYFERVYPKTYERF